ncbi:unnamed protein product [Phaedon cochleariae]|uniref:IMD domain-containing protein n=1 Tax=Phaedon cochleariae TaxID=80249 RepID=A0A9N9SIU7_PHACE|nr:unnamed protein product [Phaedon cochleariae]
MNIMEGAMERESGALGGLFHQIIQDMKYGMPLWEDLITKATKLHSSLKATILAVTAYLDAFQKIADSATSARGATRDIGTALTRICLRHKAVEARMKNFTSVIMECLILPLQDKLEEWKKTVVNLDKDHAKDYKRARTELKKRSTDTLRLQKKMRKGAGGDLQKRFECGLQDVTERRQLLEETAKQAVRAALDEEVAMLTEIGHLQEAVQQLTKHSSDPAHLPPASEQVIADLKGSEGGWSFRTPPSSPSSLGSRKSSMCSISSINSSSSSGSKSHHHSPSHPWQRSLSQVSNMSEHSNNSSSSNTPCTPFPVSVAPTTTATWPNLQETMQFERAASAIISDRPHTISSAYEKGHQRPPLTVYTFQAPEQSISQPASPVTSTTPTDSSCGNVPPKSPAASIKSITKPPLPTRCSSLERHPAGPAVPAKSTVSAVAQGVRVLPPGAELALKKPSPLPAHLAKAAQQQQQPTYVNMHELASMAANKVNEGEKESSTSESSLESSSGYGSQTTFTVEDAQHLEVKALTELKHTPASPNSIRRMSSSSQNLYQASQGVAPTAPLSQPSGPAFSTFHQSKVAYVSQSGGVVYAQPAQVGAGSSPNVVRRIASFRSQSADRKSEGPGGVGSNFIASLSAKLAPQLSPRTSRKLSDDRTPTNSPMGTKYHHQQQHHQQQQQQPKMGPGQCFLESLNAKLSQQHLSNVPQPQPDPKVCHESLMDQIKRGATLKRAKMTNDRSAPKIY